MNAKSILILLALFFVHPEQPTCLWQVEKEMTLQNRYGARPGGPAAKREPSPEGLGLDSEWALSALGAALT
jgi:hypothetical protein